MFHLRVLPLLLAAGLAVGCKSNQQPAAYQGEGRLIAEGPAREVITSPDGGAVAWLADPQLASDKGVNASNQVYVGKVRVAPVSGGPALTLGDGVATLPGTFFFSPSGEHLGALTGWDFANRKGTFVLADLKKGEARQVAEDVSFFGFSQDGRQVAYVADRKLYVQRSAGSPPVEIATQVSTFEFSPDGGSIAVRRRSIGGGGELLLVELAAPKKARVLVKRAAEYDWSPEGERLAYTARNEEGRSDLFLVEGGGKAEKLGTGVTTFRFSPDGKHLAFLGDTSFEKQFGDLYVRTAAAKKPTKIGETVTDFEFDPTSRRIGWLNKYRPQSRGGNLTWAELNDEPKAHRIATNVPSFTWSHGGDEIAFAYRQTEPIFSIDLHLFRIGEDEKSVMIGRGVFGYSFSADDGRVFFRTHCTRNARSCDLQTVQVGSPTEPASLIANGIFTYEPDPDDQSMLMITYARTDADALDVAAVPADGSAGPKTLDRMVAHGTKFLGGSADRIAYAVLDKERMGVYVAEPPAFEKAPTVNADAATE